ncbi:MAG: hypothetical protein F9K45_05355 [Melioribacteraceae bacterium]|nr:MAG: hypothetical protein F9K45_05355 [Melioribacteraceae bacterium]
MMDKGKIIALDSPKKIKESIGRVVVEVVCSPIRKAYQTIKENTEYDTQLFGDRINVVINSFEKEFPAIEELLINNEVNIIDKRIVTPTLENVFIYLIKEAS